MAEGTFIALPIYWLLDVLPVKPVGGLALQSKHVPEQAPLRKLARVVHDAGPH